MRRRSNATVTLRRPRGPRGPVARLFERVLLGIGLSMVAFVLERRVLKAIRKGGFRPAPRTGGVDEPEPSHDLAAVPDQAGQQPEH